MLAQPNDIEPYVPVSEPVFLILLALTDGPSHGYGVLLNVEARTNGAHRLGTGTVYSAIKRLLRDELLAEVESPPDEQDPRRKFYALTPLGLAVVKAEAERHARLADLARASSLLTA